jgi:ribosomal protein S10
LVDVLDPTARTLEALSRLNVPAGVDISIKT